MVQQALLLIAALSLIALWRTVRGTGRRATAERRLGQYQLHEKIGEGAMGEVYRASQTGLARPAAVKLLRPERSSARDRQRFEREAELTRRLTHPNTVEVYDFGRGAGGALYYAMEYVEGETLESLVEREGRLAPERVARLLAQLAGALHEAHGMGLIHRDVKPQNVMVVTRAEADLVKVLDFGLLKQLGEDAGQDDDDRVSGTPLYLAPEALTAPESMDARSDLYSLGALGYYLLTGTPPFSGRGVVEVCKHHLESAPVPPSRRAGIAVPRELEASILSCLAKRPEERPASAAVLQARLLRLAVERPAPLLDAPALAA
jgi:eukaryotic-like serine/threonine-protein kinase